MKQANWIVIADFFDDPASVWLDDFIADDHIRFEKIGPTGPRRNWHKGKLRKTPLGTWLKHLRHAYSAVSRKPDGIITCFPQLAICAALWKSLSVSNPAIIAYNFNLGDLKSGWRQRLAIAFSKNVDLFVVHSPEEVARYSKYLRVPQGRVVFAPLQRGQPSVSRSENLENPFVIAMGSAHRDYETLISAADSYRIPTLIITRASDLVNLPTSQHVKFLSDLSERECLELLSSARICVTPLSNISTASGQVTFVNAMQLGVPVIATKCPGTAGYITHQKNGLLVEPFDKDELGKALDALWKNQELREKLSGTALADARSRFSDKAAAERLRKWIHEVSGIARLRC